MARQRGRVHLAVLADLQREGVEAERLHLPAQGLHLAVGDAGHAVVDERGLQLVDLGEQVGG